MKRSHVGLLAIAIVAPTVAIAQAGDLAATRVLVSRREVRVVFPPDTNQTWGWPETTHPYLDQSYRWWIGIDGIDGPRGLTLAVHRSDSPARGFTSLRSVIHAGTAQLCSPGMIQVCSGPGLSAHVDDHQVVIALRDSATIMQLFGLRQPTVDVFRARSRDSVTQQATPVRVTYVAPDIPIPDSAFRVLAARRRRQYEASVSSIIRSIQIGDNRWGTSAWLELGDTVSLRVEELRCHFDACSGYSFVVRDSRWTIDDTSVADMRRSVDAFGEPSSYLRTNRPGTTRLRIDLPARASDTMPSREPPPRTLERLVVVTEPIARVEISPRPDTVRVGDHIAFRVRVIDRLGQELSAAPFELTVQGGAYNGIYPGPTPTQVAFDSAGARTLIGRMGKRADTLVLRVVEPRKR